VFCCAGGDRSAGTGLPPSSVVPDQLLSVRDVVDWAVVRHNLVPSGAIDDSGRLCVPRMSKQP